MEFVVFGVSFAAGFYAAQHPAFLPGLWAKVKALFHK